MERKCIRCGENMILDCQLSLSEGIGSIYKKDTIIMFIKEKN